MINAGLTIHSFDGNQQYNSTSNTWDNIAITVNYPSGQNATDNPVSVGDYILEPIGNIWEVTAVVQSTGNDFSLSLMIKNDTPSSSISPNLGLTNRGSVVSSINNVITPYWDRVLVSSEIAQIAAIYNTEQNNYGGTVTQEVTDLQTTVGTIQTDLGTIQTDLSNKADTSAVSTIQTDLSNKLSLTGGTVTGDVTIVGSLTEKSI